MKLEIYYKRQMDRNYMVIKGQENHLYPDYEMRMLEENEIVGFMKVNIMPVDCHLEYCYDISSLQPLERLYRKKKLKLEEIKLLFLALKRQMEQMEPYLLDSCHLILNPEYIYIHPQSFQIYFCYHTEMEKAFQQGVRELIQFVLEKLDHEDQNGIVAVYQMYQRSLEDAITVEELLTILFDGKEKQEEEQVERAQEQQNDTMQEEVIAIQTNSERTVWKGEIIDLEEGQTIWQENESWKRIAIFFGSVITLGIAAVWFVLKGMWRETRQFLLFLGATTILLLYNIWNLQQIRTSHKKQDNTEQVESAQLLSISYEKEEIKQDYIDEKKGATRPGNTGLLQEETEHALISQNPGKWNHIQITQYPCIVGRSEESCNVVIDFTEISRLHGEFQKKEDGIWLMDLNSLNGTYINGTRLEANTPSIITSGDCIRFANISYIFH